LLPIPVQRPYERHLVIASSSESWKAKGSKITVRSESRAYILLQSKDNGSFRVSDSQLQYYFLLMYEWIHFHAWQAGGHAIRRLCGAPFFGMELYTRCLIEAMRSEQGLIYYISTTPYIASTGTVLAAQHHVHVKKRNGRRPAGISPILTL